MKKCTIWLFSSLLIVNITPLVSGNGASWLFHQTRETQPRAAYHDHPPIGPVPETLDPTEFEDDRAVFLAYTLAGRIKDLLYQEPCYCPCHKLAGHESLLDCFTGRHGVTCKTCKVQAVFCYEQHRRGQSPAQIREAMAKGQAWKFDLDKYVEQFFAKSEGK